MSVTVTVTCKRAYKLIARTIDDADGADDARLSGQERAALRRHLASCGRCREEYETQHEVRRLLVLHIQDGPPAGFDARLNAQLARTSRPLPSGWGVRLLPLAAALVLMVVEPAVRNAAPPPAGAASTSSSRTAREEPGQPRAFTTVPITRHDDSSRRHRQLPAAAEDVTRAAETAHPLKDESDGDVDRQRPVVAAAESGRATIEQASRAAREVPVMSRSDETIPASEPRAERRKRLADERDDKDDATRERAASERPGILPRPPAPGPTPFPPLRR